MSSQWHYQLMRHLTESGETYYAIHEYFPLDSGPAWTSDPVTIDGETKSDIVWMLKAMLHDIEKHGVNDYEND